MSTTGAFSYAQAAKGQASVQPANLPPAIPAPPASSSQGKDETVTFIAVKSSRSLSAASLIAKSHDQTRSPPIAAETSTSTRSEPDTAPVRGSVPPASAVADPIAKTGEAESSATVESQDAGEATVSSSQGGTEASEISEPAESRKSRKPNKSSKNGDKSSELDQGAESDAEKEAPLPPAPKPVLSEAKIPSVNIWQQRIQVQAAKAKLPPVNGVLASTPAGPAVEETKKKTPVNEPASHSATDAFPSAEKNQRKSGEMARSGDGPPPKRNGPRGSRAQDKEDKVAKETLPAVTDATSWPTPETAAVVDEGKPRSQDKVDRSENTAPEDIAPTKRHKEKWVAMPYVPSVTFQTPLPARGGRPSRGGSRGGREANSRNQSAAAGQTTSTQLPSPGADKSPAAVSGSGAQGPSRSGEARSRENSSPAVRAASLPPAPTKRTSMDGSFSREQRKPSVPTGTGTERARDYVPEASTDVSQNPSNKGETSRPQPENAFGGPDSFAPRNPPGERRMDSFTRGFDYSKDSNTSGFKDATHSGRERGEGRGGRGGHRGGGRGLPSQSNNNLPSHPPPSTYGPSHGLPPASAARQNSGYSPSAGQGPFAQQIIPGQQRPGGRGNNGRLSLGNGLGRGASGVKVHTPSTVAPAYYQPSPAEFSPVPYNDLFQSGLIQVIMLQVEYYLSVDNLCKDTYLRQHMDSQGFVPLSFVATFKRMRELAPTLEPIRLACENSQLIDYVVGLEDGVERLRPREKWDRWVLDMNERAEEARGHGPGRFHWRSHHSRPMPTYPSSMLPPTYPTASPTNFPPAPSFPGEDALYGHYPPNGGTFEPSMTDNNINGHGYSMGTPLSATVPDFSPNGAALSHPLDAATTFTDQQAESLTLLFTNDKKEGQNAGPRSEAPTPLTNGSAQNGVITSNPVSPTSHGVNGTRREPGDATGVNENAARPHETSPTPQLSAVTWTDDQRPAIIAAKEPTKEYYPDFRLRALQARQNARPGETPKEMKLLYEFWSHFLPRNFNARMYEEFRNYALEDTASEMPSRVGLGRLLAYYENVLFGKAERPSGLEKPIVAEVLLRHYEEARGLQQPINGGPYA